MFESAKNIKMMRQQTKEGKVHAIDPLLSKVCYKNCLNFKAKGSILGYMKATAIIVLFSLNCKSTLGRT